MSPLSLQDALVYLMVTTSAADRTMNDEELSRIGALVQTLPIFAGFNSDSLPHVAAKCAEMLNDDDGLDIVLGIVKSSLPEAYADTAYALVVEIAVADLIIEQEELRFLQIVRDALNVDKMTAAAIELSAKVRHREL